MKVETLETRRLLAVSTINWNTVNQTIDGFGASSAWTTQSVSTAQQQILFSPTNGSGMTLLRSRILPDTSASSWEIQTMQKAQAMGAKVWSTPWSPPAAWKDNNNVNNGGALLASHYQDYANLLAQYVTNMKNNGITLYGISIQNEPDWLASYESCIWTAAQFAAFLPYLHNAWVANNLTTKVIMAEQAGWKFDLSATVMADPTLNSYIDIYAAHDYDNGKGLVPGAAGKSLWMTEVYDMNGSDTGITSGIWVATNIYNMLITSRANAYHYWWIHQSGNGGLLDGNWQQTKLFWSYSNYSRFIRPGWVNVGETDDGGMLISSYKNPATNEFAEVLVNNSASAITETINLNGIYAPILTPWITSATLNLAQQTPIPTTGNGSTFTYTIPAKSVVTLTGTGVSSPVTAPPAGLTISSTTTTGATLNWTNNITGATGYTVQRSTDGTTWTTRSSTIPSTTFTYSDTGLTGNTLYYYRVIANNGTVYSNVAYSMTLPNAPTNLAASYSAATQNVTLTWTASTTASVDYMVERSSDGGTTWTNITAGIKNGTNTYTDTAAPELTTLNYRVRSVYGANTSAATANVSATTTVVKAPSALAAVAGTTAGTVKLNWTNNTTSTATTVVERSINNGSTWSVLTTVANGLATYTDTTTTAGGTFLYRVRANLGGTFSAYSATVSYTISILTLTGTTGNDTFYFKRNGTNLDIWQNAATPGSGTPTQSVVYASVTLINITGNTGNDVVTLDYAGGTPVTTSGISFDGTSGTDSETIINSPGNVSASITDGQVVFGTDPITFTNLDTFNLNLGAGTNTLTSAVPVMTSALALTIDLGSTVTLGASSTLPANTTIALAGTLNLGGQNEPIEQLTGSGTLTSSGGTVTIGANGSSSTFAGVISGAVGLTKAGAGTFTLTGACTFTGATDVNTGTLTLAPTGTMTIGSNNNSWRVAPNNTDNATLNIGAGVTLNCGTSPFGGFYIGCASNSISNGGVGVVNQTGGTLNVSGLLYMGGANTVVNGANATWNFSGGVANVNALMRMSTNNNSISALNVSGTAQLNLQNNNVLAMGLYFGRPSSLTMTGGSINFYSDAGTTLGGTGSLTIAGGTSTINLNGGTLAVPKIVWNAASGGAGGGSQVFNFGGGTLKVTSANTDLFPTGHVTVNLSANTANIDTNGSAVTLTQNLIHPASLGATADGGVTKKGAGTLTLSGVNTYTGATNIQAGTLEVSGTHNSNHGVYTVSSGGTIAVKSSGIISGSGTPAALSVAGTGVANVNGGQATFASINASNVTIQNNGKLTIATHTAPPNATNFDVISGALTITTGGQIDLKNNALVIRSSDTSNNARNAAFAQITGGQNGFDNNGLQRWDGSGIVSAFVRSQNVALGVDAYAIGIISNHDLIALSGGPGSEYGLANPWLGTITNIGTNDILIRPTYAGDTNLDGRVNIDDYNNIDGTFLALTGNFGWASGDFNFDGTITIDDFNVIDAGYLYDAGQLI